MGGAQLRALGLLSPHFLILGGEPSWPLIHLAAVEESSGPMLATQCRTYQVPPAPGSAVVVGLGKASAGPGCGKGVVKGPVAGLGNSGGYMGLFC